MPEYQNRHIPAKKTSRSVPGRFSALSLVVGDGTCISRSMLV